MKTELKAKLLQHFSKKNKSGGFTLIELLVVIIIIGVLSAIALPSFLNQANKAKQSEAKTYVGSLNRGQQAYLLENGQFFIPAAPAAGAQPDISALGLGIDTQTQNYQYGISGTAASDVLNGATARSAALKAYAGGVALGAVAGGNATTLAVLCEAPTAGTSTTPSIDFTTTAGTPACTATWKDLSN